MIVIALLKFKLMQYNFIIQHLNQYAMGPPHFEYHVVFNVLACKE